MEAAASLYERGLEAIPDCVLLHIAYAELEEKRSVPSPTPCRTVVYQKEPQVALGKVLLLYQVLTGQRLCLQGQGGAWS